MRVLLVLTLLPLAAAAAPSKGATKPGDGCSALSERRLELSRELDLLDATIAEKRKAIADASAIETVMELGAETNETIVDLATPTATATPAMTSEAALKKIQKLQLEITGLEPKREALSNKLARVRSTLTQSCPAK